MELRNYIWRDMDDQIEKNQKVTISYTLKDTSGILIEEVTQEHPISYLHGHHNIVPGLEKLLEGRHQGEHLHVTVPSHEAYGPYLDDLVMEVPRDELSEVGELKVGMEIEMLPEDDEEDIDSLGEDIDEQLRTPSDPSELFGEDEIPDDELDDEPAIFTIREIHEDHVVLDGNHPLAGRDLVFDVKILAVDTASFEEIEQGFPEGMEEPY